MSTCNNPPPPNKCVRPLLVQYPGLPGCEGHWTFQQSDALPLPSLPYQASLAVPGNANCQVSDMERCKVPSAAPICCVASPAAGLQHPPLATCSQHIDPPGLPAVPQAQMMTAMYPQLRLTAAYLALRAQACACTPPGAATAQAAAAMTSPPSAAAGSAALLAHQCSMFRCLVS
jgi:hypothetical protein